MKSRHIRNRFHADRLRPFLENDETSFPGREAKFYYDYGVPEDEEWYVDAIVGHTWQGRKIKFNVQWSLGDTTWEPYEHCKDLVQRWTTTLRSTTFQIGGDWLVMGMGSEDTCERRGDGRAYIRGGVYVVGMPTYHALTSCTNADVLDRATLRLTLVVSKGEPTPSATTTY
jgi:hypothetical protein